MKPATSHRVDLRGLEHHVLAWGAADAPPLFMLHGWMDVAASFQFLVDAFAHEWRVIAPDLRGFGRSAWQAQGYWYADYIADVEALLDHFAPDGPVHLLGHSLGGNVALHYAGIRPERIAKLVSLEGFGIPRQEAAIAPRKLAQWLDGLRTPPTFASYANLEAVARRLQKNNPRLPDDKARFLAQHWAEVLPDGTARLTSDPRHKLPFPSVYRVDEVFAVWRCITAPTLWVAARDSHIPQWLEEAPEGDSTGQGMAGVRRRLGHIAGAELVVVDDAGHMLHHDQPAAVARAVEAFLLR